MAGRKPDFKLAVKPKDDKAAKSSGIGAAWLSDSGKSYNFKLDEDVRITKGGVDITSKSHWFNLYDNREQDDWTQG